MKKLLLLGVACLFVFGGCSSAFPQSSSASMGTISSENSEIGVLSSLAEPTVYTNQELGFSFSIPAEWSSSDYKIVVSHGKQQEDISSYSQIDFLFRSDKENPLLRIYVVSSKWWGQYKSKSENGAAPLVYLGKKEDAVYCYELPAAVPYSEESAANTYNSMMLTSEQVSSSFSTLD